MGQKDKILMKIDRAKSLVVFSLLSGIGSAAVAGLVLFTGVAFKTFALDVYALSIIPFTMVFLFSVSSLVCGALMKKAAQEDEEKELLRRRLESRSSMLDTSEDVRFTAQRTLDNFCKYAPYVIAVVALLVCGLSLAAFWRSWSVRLDQPVVSNGLQMAFLAAVLMFGSLFAGAFCIGQSHEREFRWLRSVGEWLIVGFALTLFASLAAILGHWGYPAWGVFLRNAAFVLLAVLCAEFAVNFITEFYRPRTAEEERPVFESGLLALFTEPGGVVRNIAEALDYQFGFKVSKTWIYSFMEASLVPLALLWLASLWLFTCIAEVGPNERGIRENFGRVVSTRPLEPGIYLKLPSPFGEIARYPVDEVQEVVVGENEGSKEKEGRPEIVLWTKAHYAGKSMLVASEKSGADAKEVPVSLLNVAIPIQFKIREDSLLEYAYRNKDPKLMLKSIGEKATSKYFASVDFLKTMSVNRWKTVSDLKSLIQKASDEQGLGIEILSVNFHDAHPPVEKVSPAFQEVIGAQEEKEAAILSAQAYERNIVPQAESQAAKIVMEAESHKDNAVRIARADADRFLKQLKAYSQMPKIYRLRTYLDFLENDCKDIKKLLMASSFKYEVYNINLEEKQRLDLLDADLGEITNKK